MKLLTLLIFPHLYLQFNFWSAIATIGGALLGARSSKKAAEKSAEATVDANQAQIASAREQMAFQQKTINDQMKFQERMSNTAHQRQIKDLRKAGLNPILSSKYGGASTPSGSIGSGAQAAIQSAAPAWSAMGQQQSSAWASAGQNVGNQLLQQQQINANVEQIDQNINNLKSSEGLTKMQTVKASAEINSIQAQARYLASQADGIDIKNAVEVILKDYYNSNKADLVARDMGLTKIKYLELLESYFKKYTGFSLTD